MNPILDLKTLKNLLLKYITTPNSICSSFLATKLKVRKAPLEAQTILSLHLQGLKPQFYPENSMKQPQEGFVSLSLRVLTAVQQHSRYHALLHADVMSESLHASMAYKNKGRSLTNATKNRTTTSEDLIAAACIHVFRTAIRSPK